MKKFGFKRSISLLLAFVLLTAMFAACGKKGGDEELSEFVYVPNYTKLPAEVREMRNVGCAGDTLYFTAQAAVRPDGTEVTAAELEQYEKDMQAYYSSGGGGAVGSIGGGMINAVGGSSVTVMRTAATPEATPPIANDDVANPDASGDAAAEPPEMEVTYVNYLYSIKTDGTGYQRLAEYVPPVAPDEDSYANLNKIIPTDDGGVWVVEEIRKNIYDLPADFDPATGNKWEHQTGSETQYLIRKLSNTGKELSSINVGDFVDMTKFTGEMGGFYIQDVKVDKQGNVFIGENQNIYVVNAEGVFQFTIKMDNYFSGFVSMKDGSLGVMANGQTGNAIKLIDVAAKGWGKEVKAPNNAWRTSSGGSTYDFCYTDNTSLMGYDSATETSTKILSWINSDIDGDRVEYSTVAENGDVFAVTQSEYTEDSQDSVGYELVTLVKTARADVPEKKTLTMAIMWLDYNIKAQVLKFNKANPEYRIEILDYSEYNTDEDYTAGQTKLNTEIISGNVPDLIQTSGLPWEQYAAKGLLEDIYPFMEKDPELKRENFVQSILKALEIDGKLYQAVSGFSIQSIVGKKSVVGEGGWNIQELQQIVKDHPEADVPFGPYTDRATIFQYFCMLNLQSYMDWQTGECKFDTADFKAMLEFAKTFPEKIDNSEYENGFDESALISEGRQLFKFTYVNSFDNGYQYEKAVFGGEAAFKGFPCEDKKGNVANIEGGLAITSSCKDKDGAWSFVKTLLSEDFQKNLWSMPINQKVFDDKLAEAMKQEYTTDENGNKVPISNGGMSMGNGPMIEFYALTQEEADQIIALVESVEKIGTNNEGVMNIIKEEADAFFAGEKTVDEVAAIIQSRMTIYVNEQR